MPFTFSLVSDVRSFLKGTKDVEQALSQVSDSLDTLARDTAQDADQAASKLESEFKRAFDKVQSDAKQTGDTVGTRVKEGTEKASEGTTALKENAASNAKEIAASFDGSAQSIADGFQGLAAEAFEGFGPAGVAAGVAAAAGIGLASTAIQRADDAAAELKQHTLDLGKSLATAESRAQGMADAISDALSASVDNPQNVVDAIFGKGGTDRLTLYSDLIANAGLEYGDVLKAMQGDEEAFQRVSRKAWADSDAAHEQSTYNFIADLDKQRQASVNAQTWADEYSKSQVKAQQDAAEAQQHASDVAADWAQSLNDHLNVAADGLDQFVKDGKLNLNEWAAEVKRRTKEVATVEDFKVDVFPKLSPQAQEEFAKLPVETQAQIAEAYKKSPKKVEAILKAQAKLEVDPKDTHVDPVNIPTTVDTSAAQQQTEAAAAAAQHEANRAGNVIELKTKIDQAELQRQVNRAAAGITAPTIYVNVKPRKEIP